VLASFPDNVRLVYEDFGESALTDRYRIKGYPAVFVNEQPVVLPQDLGYFGAGENAKYQPWADPATQQRFATDLETVLRRAVAGESFAEFVSEISDADPYPVRLPSLTMTDSHGAAINLENLSGRVVIVDFWATWCPPCRRTLPEMEALSTHYGDRLAVVTVCLSSPADELERVRARLAPGLPAVAGTDEVLAAFGSVVHVPTLMVFGPDGARAQVYIGAPEDLPRQLETLIEGLLN